MLIWPGYDLGTCISQGDCSGGEWVVAVVGVVPGGKGAAVGGKGVLRLFSRAPNAGLQLPRSLSAAANITTRSRIGDSPYATRLANRLSEGAQRDVDNLLAQLRAGNANPGIGTRPLGDGFFELRGANAGRVIVKQTSAGTFDIVGKFQAHVRGGTANSQIIQRLMSDFGKL